MLPEYALDGRVRQPVGAAIQTAAPTNTYPCSDGRWLCIAGNSDLIFSRLMAAVGRPELARDPAYATNGDALRLGARHLTPRSLRWTPSTLPAKQAEEVLEAAEVPGYNWSPDIADIAADPHFWASGAAA